VGGQAACTPIAAPRPVAPASTSTSTSQRPRFAWILPSGDDGAEVEICADRACTTPVSTFVAAGSSAKAPIGLRAGVYYWRLRGTAAGQTGTQTSAVWEFLVGARSAPVATSWGTMLDVDGDGAADLVVGAAPNALAGGSAYVFLGGASGLSPNVTLGPGGPVGAYGRAVANLGDINGDGYADVAVDAYISGSGFAYYYLGGPAGLSTTPTAIVPPTPVNSGSDVLAIAAAGDVNADGYADIVVGDGLADLVTGVAYVYLGGPEGLGAPLTLVDPAGAKGAFGISVAGAGDVDGDGYADVVVGASDYSGSAGFGAAYVYRGGPRGPSSSPVILASPSSLGDLQLGSSVASANDVNGDGYADILVTAYAGSTGKGAAYLYFGSANGIVDMPAQLTDPTGTGAGFGISISSGGDVDGDGFADVVVGSMGGQARDGYLYRGGPGGLSTTPAEIDQPTTITGFESNSIASVGDVNADGFADVAVGVPTAGIVYVYYGSAAGLTLAPVTITAASAGSFGAAVAMLRGAPLYRHFAAPRASSQFSRLSNVSSVAASTSSNGGG
jgi:hypothetical protein